MSADTVQDPDEGKSSKNKVLSDLGENVSSPFLCLSFVPRCALRPIAGVFE